MLRLLEKDPSRRYASAQELLGELTLIDPVVQGAVGSVRRRLGAPGAAPTLRSLTTLGSVAIA